MNLSISTISVATLSAALGVAAVLLGADTAHAGEGGRLTWQAVRVPVTGPARAIGSYGAGCIVGAAELPFKGPGYRVARPERHRHFGHPALVDFVRKLGAAVHARGLRHLWIGDLGQPRGGPAPTGHASHQTGLDVDIWYAGPDAAGAAAAVATASTGAGQTPPDVPASVQPLPMANVDTNELTPQWTAREAQILQWAASDPRVDRIFVHPVIKQAMCDRAGEDRAWLRKLRPWWGHHEHFHVRLACPADNAACRTQPPLPAGDGCAGLAWWFDQATDGVREAKRNGYRARVGGKPRLPAACHRLLATQDGT